MVPAFCVMLFALLAVSSGETYLRTKRGATSITIGKPVVYKEPGNHTVEVGQDFQFYCKIKANPLAHVAMKFNPVDNPITVNFPKYGTSPTGGSTIVLLDLVNLKLRDEGRYTCFAENEHGTVQAHGWLKFAKACSCNQYGVAYPSKPCDDAGDCVCRENVTGDRCDRCQEGFFNFPFCAPCDCNEWGTVDQSLSCDAVTGECNCLPDKSIFNPTKCDGCPPGDYWNPVTTRCQPCRCFAEGSESSECDYLTGQCQCKDNYESTKCTQCKPGFFDRDNGCKPCECVYKNVYDSDCDIVSGQCSCKPGLVLRDPRTCASCPHGTVYDDVTDTCEEELEEICKDCDVMGTERCISEGKCECKENFTGRKCDQCEENHYGFEKGSCTPCECNPYGVVAGNLGCDKDGRCDCKEGQDLIDKTKCDGCPEAQTISHNSAFNGACVDCKCHPRGAVDDNCDLYTGECVCREGVTGSKCDECQPGYYGLDVLGECLSCDCDPENSRARQCDQDSGQCPCYNDVITDTRTCSGCRAGHYSAIDGTCLPCNCSPDGSISNLCSNEGQCTCLPTVQGLKCDECKPGFFNFEAGGCVPCNCNEHGVMDPSVPCDPTTGQCQCKADQDRISTRTCDGCPDGFFIPHHSQPNTCQSCGCNPRGSANTDTCNLYTGQCQCKDNVMGRTCDACPPGFYGLNILGIEACIPCQCDPEGAVTPACDMYGQCQCREGYGSLDRRTCQGCPPGEYGVDGQCVPCGCDPKGSVSDECQTDGRCYCGPNVAGDKCDDCKSGFYFGDPNFVGCVPCGCNRTGTQGGTKDCDAETGQCECREDPALFFLDPRRCEPCEVNQFSNNGACDDCRCHPRGSIDLQCDFTTGQCNCEEGAYGVKCDACENGYFDVDSSCLPCNCDTKNTISGLATCADNGQCRCKAGLAYTDTSKCTTCGEGTFHSNGQCQPCDCHEGGSFDGNCDSASGQCKCLSNVAGRRCDECVGDTYGINSGSGCKPCECNTLGTVGKSRSCDPATGQCECKEGQTRYESRTCDGCRDNIMYKEYLDQGTEQCTACDCVTDGSLQLNCTLYEGACDCLPGIIGKKCDTIVSAVGDVVEEGDKAILSCALPAGTQKANKTTWIGPNGCVSRECPYQTIFEEPDWMSFTYVPQEDESYTCRFQFGDVIQDQVASVDVVSFTLPQIRVQKGDEAELVATFSGMREPPKRGIEWRNQGVTCTAKKCKIDGHEVIEEVIQQDGEWTLTSRIRLGAIQHTTKYTARIKYSRKIFSKFAIVDVYECNCNPVGSTNDRCDADTLRCECKTRFEGLKCDTCKDGSYDAANGCAKCNCDPDYALNDVCDKESGQCSCLPDIPFVDTRRCEKCPATLYLLSSACVPCGCHTDNTLSNSDSCDDLGQCSCIPALPYVDTRICERCPAGQFLKDGACQDCGCHTAGSSSATCHETAGTCTCNPHYTGDKCDTCVTERYGPDEGCRPCTCDPDNSDSNVCDGVTGQCQCREENGPFVDPVRCGACGDNTILVNGKCFKCPLGTLVMENTCAYCSTGKFLKAGVCVDCACYVEGSADMVCDLITGACQCKAKYQGHTCDSCKEGYFSPSEGCKECECVPENSLSDVCDVLTGQCRCNKALQPFLNEVTCETCPDNHVLEEGKCVECGAGQYIKNNKCVYCEEEFYLGEDGVCIDCGCSLLGASDNVCNKITGSCDCLSAYIGDKCDTCTDGYYMSGGVCKECRCQTAHTVSGDISCTDRGQCNCVGDRPYQTPKTCRPCLSGLVLVDGRCEECEEGSFVSNYQCADCDCNEVGTVRCGPRDGTCTCKPSFTGDRCNQCKDGFYQHAEECLPCNCAPHALSETCHKTSGQCSCLDNFTSRSCELCVDGHTGATCDLCGCDAAHSLSGVCDKETGQCDCVTPGHYKDTLKCTVCPDNHSVARGWCTECDRGTELRDNVCVPCEDGSYEVEGACIACPCNPLGTASCDKISGVCTCSSNYSGALCDTCVDGRYDAEAGCLDCACDPDNSLDTLCDKETGQCDCIDNMYLPDPRTCLKCRGGHVLSEAGVCERCPGGHRIVGNTCKICEEGYYLRYGQCVDCLCNPQGSKTMICDQIAGECDCDDIHQGEKCQECASGFYSENIGGACLPCNCVLENSLGGQAGDPEKGMKACSWDGQCYCKAGLRFVNSKTCQTCPAGTVVRGSRCVQCDPQTYYTEGKCAPCRCDVMGAASLACNPMTGVCSCKAGYTGEWCSTCDEGYYRDGSGYCVLCGCDMGGATSPICDKTTGQCDCKSQELSVYADPRICFGCPEGSYFSSVAGECIPCNCNIGGSDSKKCDNSGKCSCLENVTGTKCDSCIENHFGIDSGMGCTPCLCNEYGVAYKTDKIWERDMSCDEVTGQCDCEEVCYCDSNLNIECACGRYNVQEKVVKNRYDSLKCDGCPDTQYLHPSTQQCVDCNCHPEGASSYRCELYSGTCRCNPNFEARSCDTRGCNWGPWSLGDCIIDDFEKCYGWKTMYRKQVQTEGGDFSTITKYADCIEEEKKEIKCRIRVGNC